MLILRVTVSLYLKCSFTVAPSCQGLVKLYKIREPKPKLNLVRSCFSKAVTSLGFQVRVKATAASI